MTTPHVHDWHRGTHPVTGDPYAACPCGASQHPAAPPTGNPLPSEVADMRAAHAEGLHDGDDAREFCPDCEATDDTHGPSHDLRPLPRARATGARRRHHGARPVRPRPAPTPTGRDGPSTQAVRAAAVYLQLDPTPALLDRALALAPTISDATLNYTQRSPR